MVDDVGKCLISPPVIDRRCGDGAVAGEPLGEERIRMGQDVRNSVRPKRIRTDRLDPRHVTQPVEHVNDRV